MKRVQMRPRLCICLSLTFALAGVAFFATGCGGSKKPQLRLVNAMTTWDCTCTTLSSLDMLVDGSSVASNVYALDNNKIAPKASSYASVNSGLRHIQVVPSGSNTPIIDTKQNLSSGTATTVLAYSDLSLITKWSFLADNNAAPSSGNFNIRFINAYDPAPEGIDIYVLPPGADFFNSKPNVSHLQEGAASGYVSLPAGTYDISVTVGGNKDVLTYTPSFISFAAGQVRTGVYAVGIELLADGG